MAKGEIKEAVASKLGLAYDMKDAKVQTTIDNVKKVDGKISANFSISGLPTKKEEESYSSSYRNIPKIFDSIEEFSKYATNFFNATDEELIKIAKG